jgi:hypothetical protein
MCMCVCVCNIENAVQHDLDDAAELDKIHHFVNSVKHVLEEEAQEEELFHHANSCIVHARI